MFEGSQLPLHFVWIGPKLPWFVEIAVQSALTACPRAQVSLWATDDLGRDPGVTRLHALGRFALRRLTDESLLDAAPSERVRGALAPLLGALRAPAARANVARLLILLRHGGIYLDSDTLTLRDLTPLWQQAPFCGLEHVVWPADRPRGATMYGLFGGPLRSAVRSVCARAPRGERLFRKVAGWYARAANNAVLGFPPDHPFLHHMLDAIIALPADECLKRYRLGTHLLQHTLVGAGAQDGVRCLPPEAFYPLGPELSRQYFEERSDAARVAGELVDRGAYAVHWYASVSDLAAHDPETVRAQADRTIFAALCARVLETAAPREQLPAAVP